MYLPKTFYAVKLEDKRDPTLKLILYANGTDVIVGYNPIPFTSYSDAKDAAEIFSIKFNSEILSWELKI
jgi:hypothetical protein